MDNRKGRLLLLMVANSARHREPYSPGLDNFCVLLFACGTPIDVHSWRQLVTPGTQVTRFIGERVSQIQQIILFCQNQTTRCYNCTCLVTQYGWIDWRSWNLIGTGEFLMFYEAQESCQKFPDRVYHCWLGKQVWRWDYTVSSVCWCIVSVLNKFVGIIQLYVVVGKGSHPYF